MTVVENNEPVVGTLYHNPGLRGRWRVETAGLKIITLRSLDVVVRGGRLASWREKREDWPNGWERA